jgi:hypothetical protein
MINFGIAWKQTDGDSGVYYVQTSSEQKARECFAYMFDPKDMSIEKIKAIPADFVLKHRVKVHKWS